MFDLCLKKDYILRRDAETFISSKILQMSQTFVHGRLLEAEQM